MLSPSDLLATPLLNAFQNVALAIIIERQDKLNFSDQCQTKFLLPKSQNEFYDLLPIPSCTSSTKTKVKDMENMLIFHVTVRIQILTAFSAQSQYSKKTKSISLLGFVISNKTCKIWNMQIRYQPSRLISPSMKNKFTASNAENIQWIHLTTDVKFSHFFRVSPPKQRSKCRCCKKSLSYFSQALGGVQGNVPILEIVADKVPVQPLRME